MALSTAYIPASTFSEPQLDKDTGQPLAAGVVKFYRDLDRSTPNKSVFMLTGTPGNYTFVDIGAVLTFGLNGTFTDQNGNQFIPYFKPYTDEDPPSLDLYYVTIDNSDGVRQYTLSSVPYLPPGSLTPEGSVDTSNEILNPQFTEVSFNPATGHTYTVGVGTNNTEIAANWFVTTSTAGTFTVDRVEVIDLAAPTNPPYAIKINASAGLGGTVTLTQRFLNSPRLLKDQTVSGSLVAATIGAPAQITMKYVPSNPAATTHTIFQKIVNPGGSFQELGDIAPINGTPNPDGADTGYVDIQITIPTGQEVTITSVQVVGSGSGTVVSFDQQSTQIQTNGLFQYYEEAILLRPKQTILTGWQFALNPWQFTTTALTNVATNQYTADQTIVVQAEYVNSLTGNTVSVGRETVAPQYADFRVQAVTASNRFAIIQYIDPATIRPYWGTNFSALVQAKINTTVNTQCRYKMKLLSRTTLPATIGRNEPIATWTPGNEPTFDVAWTPITAKSDPTYTLSSTTQFQAFNNFALPSATTETMTLAIVIYTLDDISSTGTPDSIDFFDVALTPDYVAHPTYVLTADEMLSRCQYYYEKSYNLPDLPGAINDIGVVAYPMPWAIATTAITMESLSYTFNVQYKKTKRANPVFHFYSPTDGAIDNIRYLATGGISNNVALSATSVVTWGFLATTSNVLCVGNSVLLGGPSAGTSHTGYIKAHYTADSRLGI